MESRVALFAGDGTQSLTRVLGMRSSSRPYHQPWVFLLSSGQLVGRSREHQLLKDPTEAAVGPF